MSIVVTNTVTQEQHDALEKIADAVASDINGDMQVAMVELGYNLYIEYIWGGVYGVIDMGEWFQEVYTWIAGEWERVPLDADSTISAITRKRERGVW